MIEYLQYHIHDFDTFLDVMYHKFIADIDDVNMLRDDIKFTNIMKRFLKSSTFEVLILKSCNDMKTSYTNVIALCKSNWMKVDRPYVDSEKFYTMVMSDIDRIKRIFPILIKKFDCFFDEMFEYLSSSDGYRVRYELDFDYQKLKSSMSFKKLKTILIENGLQYVYNTVLTKTEVQKLLIL